MGQKENGRFIARVVAFAAKGMSAPRLDYRDSGEVLNGMKVYDAMPTVLVDCIGGRYPDKRIQNGVVAKRADMLERSGDPVKGVAKLPKEGVKFDPQDPETYTTSEGMIQHWEPTQKPFLCLYEEGDKGLYRAKKEDGTEGVFEGRQFTFKTLFVGLDNPENLLNLLDKAQFASLEKFGVSDAVEIDPDNIPEGADLEDALRG